MSYSNYTQARDRMRDLHGLSDGNNQAPLSQQGTQGYELQTIQSVSATAKGNINTYEDYLSEIGDLATSIKTVNRNIDTINELHENSLISINEEQWKKNAKRLEDIVKQTSTMNNNIKRRIKFLEAINLKQPENSEKNMRKLQVAKVKTDFMTCIQRYRDVESSFRQKNRLRAQRQIRIVKQDVTDEEVDAILDSDHSNQIFTNSLLQQNRSGQAKAVLSEVQTRHDDIKQIQKTILELAQLFEEMQMLVEDQGQEIAKVESTAEHVNDDLEGGVKVLGNTISIAISTRAKKWCCFIIFLIILVVIAILVWWFAFDHPGV
ncbi:t-SNARE [Pilobolus umbonatus]|nr:t-SNARE [Pilobolus umbonatus]